MSFHIKIGNYRFSKNLGDGTFGKVKLAFNEITGHKVAIKILNRRRIKQQGVFEKVKRELKVLRLFNHPHIIKHFEFIDTPSDIFMVLEYASGGELFDLISRRERLEEHEARRFFQQIISAIEYTHAHKMAHRDLKPENLLLDENNNIKLIDFGLANSMKDSAALKTACGSPNYAAPELISGKCYGGVEVDVWSCGVILYAMVCGSLPFDDGSMAALFSKIKEGKYYMPNYISVDVKDLINRMLQPNPIKRITMREIKKHPWYNKNLPAYLQEVSAQDIKKSILVDKGIVEQLFTMNLGINKPMEEVMKAIQEKRNTEYCGVYELLHHDKLKQQCNSDQKTLQFNKRTNSEIFLLKPQPTVTQLHQNRLDKFMAKFQQKQIIPSQLLKCHSQSNNSNEEEKANGNKLTLTPSTSIHSQDTSANNMQSNILTAKKDGGAIYNNQQSTHYQFGLMFVGNPCEMVQICCQALIKMQFQWQVMPKEIKLKCRTKVDEQLANDDETIKEFLKKNFLKFYLSIYKTNKSNTEQEKYLLDVCLYKGTGAVFLNFVNNFFVEIKKQVGKKENQSTTDKGSYTELQVIS